MNDRAMLMSTTCCAKVTFVDRAAAELELSQLDRNAPRRLEQRVYRCQYGGWHLTSLEAFVDRKPAAREGNLILQPGRVVVCPWCGRGRVFVERGRVLAGHRNLQAAGLPVCEGVGRRVRYDTSGAVVKEEVRSQ
jgi:hypothetical protein